MKEGDKRFEKFIPYIEESEGEYVNDPDDPGGITNRGIAWKTWVAYAKPILGIEPTVDNLKKLSEEGARKIYKKIYWEDKKLYLIDDVKVAFMIFDWNINSGSAILKIQRLLNNKYGNNLKEDGVMGVQTVKAINRAEKQFELLKDIWEIRKDHYNNWVAQKPSEREKFKKGLLIRNDKSLNIKFK